MKRKILIGCFALGIAFTSFSFVSASQNDCYLILRSPCDDGSLCEVVELHAKPGSDEFVALVRSGWRVVGRQCK